jgi:type II secretory pathway pseudopilin PulG
MAGELVAITIVAAVCAVLVGLALLARRIRRHCSAGAAIAGAMAAYDEAFHSTANDTFQELQSAADRAVPIPSPRGTEPPRQ